MIGCVFARGNKEAVKWLMLNGCVLNYRDSNDRTPADIASLNNNDAIALLIVKCVSRLKQHEDIIETINETDLSAAANDTPYSASTGVVSTSAPLIEAPQVNSDQQLLIQLHEAIARDDQDKVHSLLKDHPHLIK